MRYTNLKEKAVDFFSEAGFVSHIYNESEYTKALELMDELIEDYDRYQPLIEVLSASIARWEDESVEFSGFNDKVSRLDDGIAVLKTLMDQHQLKAEDLKQELGSKSLVSMILNGSRNLTREHIQALSRRFSISPSVFFH